MNKVFSLKSSTKIKYWNWIEQLVTIYRSIRGLMKSGGTRHKVAGAITRNLVSVWIYVILFHFSCPEITSKNLIPGLMTRGGSATPSPLQMSKHVFMAIYYFGYWSPKLVFENVWIYPWCDNHVIPEQLHVASRPKLMVE